MTIPVVSAASSSSFLALVPHLLGFTPRRSLVLVPFSEARSLGAMRVDLPASGDVTANDSVAATVIGMACKVARTDAVALIVYTDDALGGSPELAHQDLIDAAITRADICGLRVVDALVVADDGWDSYLAPTLCAPHPLSGIAAADLEHLDLPVLDDQFAGAELPDTDPAVAAGVAAGLREIERLLGRASEGRRLPLAHRGAAGTATAALSDPPTLLEGVLAVPPAEIEPAYLAAVAFCLERPALRDVALMQWAADLATGDAVFHAQTSFHGGAAFPEELARPMWGEMGRPDPARLHKALDLCRFIASALPRERRPGALSACAWLAWATGRASVAGAYAEAALDIAPAHGLSEIMIGMIDSGRLPEWVFERPTSPAGTESSPESPAR